MNGSKGTILASIFCVAITTGAAGKALPSGEAASGVHLLIGLIVAALGFAWYRIDATEHGYRRSAALNVMVFVMSIAALPYYFFRTRGFSGGLLLTFAYIGVMTTYVILFAIARAI